MSYRPHPDKAQALDLIRAGRYPDEVAAEIGVSITTIFKWCRAAKLDYKRRIQGGPPIAPAKAKQIIALLTAGKLTRAEIAAKVGVSYGTVHNYAKPTWRPERNPRSA